MVVECSFKNVWLPVYMVFVADGQVFLGFFVESGTHSITLSLDIDGDNKFISWDLAIVAVGTRNHI